MAVWIPLLAEGERVRVKRGNLPADPAWIGKTGTVVFASEYQPQEYGVLLDSDPEPKFFSPTELEIIEAKALPPDREAAKQRRALP